MCDGVQEVSSLQCFVKENWTAMDDVRSAESALVLALEPVENCRSVPNHGGHLTVAAVCPMNGAIHIASA